jgi:hypothetical protein
MTGASELPSVAYAPRTPRHSPVIAGQSGYWLGRGQRAEPIEYGVLVAGDEVPIPVEDDRDRQQSASGPPAATQSETAGCWRSCGLNWPHYRHGQ